VRRIHYDDCDCDIGYTECFCCYGTDDDECAECEGSGEVECPDCDGYPKDRLCPEKGEDGRRERGDDGYRSDT